MVALVALFGLVPAASAATAAPPTPSSVTAADACVPGEACLLDVNGQVLYSSGGNATINMGGGFVVWNNGVRWPGLDHIQVTARTPMGTLAICLHYGGRAFGQPDPTAAFLSPGSVVVG